jgi:hypothetical protein
MSYLTLTIGLPLAIFGFIKYFSINFSMVEGMQFLYVVLFAIYYSPLHIIGLMDSSYLIEVSELYYSGPRGKLATKLILYTLLFSQYSLLNGICVFYIRFFFSMGPQDFAKFGLSSMWHLFGNLQIISLFAIILRFIAGKDKEYFDKIPVRG